MLEEAEARGFEPSRVAADVDRRGCGPEDLEAVRACGGTLLTQLKVDREVDLGRRGDRAVAAVEVAAGGTSGHRHREGFGSMRDLEAVSRGGDVGGRATNDLARGGLTRRAHAERCRAIEADRRGLEPCCGVARARVPAARARRHRIGLAIRASLRREPHGSATGVSWYEAEARIIRGAVRACIAKPMYNLT